MLLSNQEIYTHTQQLSAHYGASCELKLPVRITFFLQKNMNTLMALAQEIEAAKMEIAQKNGTPSDNGGYIIDQEKIVEVNAQLQELFSLQQDVPIHIFKLEDFDGLEFTFAQMNALMFMIEE